MSYFALKIFTGVTLACALLLLITYAAAQAYKARQKDRAVAMSRNMEMGTRAEATKGDAKPTTPDFVISEVVILNMQDKRAGILLTESGFLKGSGYT
ncbi:hypothetical protein SeLEV6574_g03900 [Synchytrium endobioticum]|uniref:Uncharacterized protein n=1 Tax=Synchytrium endobioticum TaxID=286115 RepID=A0A507D236_9FUNG|nr:hypothetical protein SeLEV6574_g03900 [Synchytrium endobioticum]